MYAKDNLEGGDNSAGYIQFQIFCGRASMMYSKQGEGLLVSLDPCVVHLLRHWYPEPEQGNYAVDVVVPISPAALQRSLDWI